MVASNADSTGNDRGRADGPERPTRFEEHPGYKRSVRKLPPRDRAAVVAQVKQFKKEWSDSNRTSKDLNTTWDYKALQGAPKQLGVMQIRLSRRRVALIVVTEVDPCVWLLEIFGRASSNKEDIDRAVERARNVRRGRA